VCAAHAWHTHAYAAGRAEVNFASASPVRALSRCDNAALANRPTA